MRHVSAQELQSGTEPNWLAAQYHIEEAGKSFLVAYYLKSHCQASAKWKVNWGLDKLREAIEIIGPETLGYQRIDHMEKAAVICGVEADIPSGGRISDCLRP